MKRLTLIPSFLSLITVTIIFAVSASGFSQSLRKLESFGDKIQSVKKTDSLVYYGLDLSRVRVTDADKITRSEKYSKLYPAAWIGFLDKETQQGELIRREMRKSYFYYNQASVQNPGMNVPEDFIIRMNYTFPVDTISAMLKKYILPEKRGTGFVIIPENFNKPGEYVSCNLVFFDIATREILWTVKTFGKADGMGYTNHWGAGIMDGLNRFFFANF